MATHSSAVARIVGPLRKKLGARYVLSRPEELSVYECDACTLVKASPDLVVLPGCAEEVAEIIRLCRQYQVPYIARGSGTGLSGGALPVEGGVIIGLNRMNRLLEINPENRTATVETGIINASLNEALKPHGLFYAPDPSSQSACTLGGNIAENAGGIHCIKYGVTADHILALEMVLPDGTITWLGSRNRRQHGFNLTGLMVGSEGTLGIATKAIVRLMPLPEKTRVYLAAFDTVDDAAQTVSDIIRQGLNPSALEFMDAFTVKAVNEAFQVGFPANCGAVLLVELDGFASQVAAEDGPLQAVFEKHHASQIRIGETPEERKALWASRKATVAAYGRYYPGFYVHDCVVPRSKLPEMLRFIGDVADRYELPIANVFHAGDGNLHPHVMFNDQDPGMVTRALKAGEEILDACLAAGGTLSGEHGIGIEKSEFMDRQFSEADLTVMKRVKQWLDPERLANPSKLFPVRRGCGEARAGFSPMALTQAANGEGLWI